MNPVRILTNLKEATSNKHKMLKKSFLLWSCLICLLDCISHKSIAPRKAVASRRTSECAKREIRRRISCASVKTPNERASLFYTRIQGDINPQSYNFNKLSRQGLACSDAQNWTCFKSRGALLWKWYLMKRALFPARVILITSMMIIIIIIIIIMIIIKTLFIHGST